MFLKVCELEKVDKAWYCNDFRLDILGRGLYMAKQKLIFLDIDGTLVDYDRQIADSSIQAIKQAQQNGHKVFICSGRMYGIIDPYIRDIGFDGYVASAGANVIIDGKSIFHRTIPADKLMGAWQILKKHKAVFRFKGKDGICVGPWEYEQYMTTPNGRRIFTKIPGIISDDVSMQNGTESGDYGMADVTVDVMQQEMDAQLDGFFTVVMASFDKPTPYFGEVTIKGITKGTGIAEIVRYLGADQADTIGIGDSTNDIDMLEYVATPVAMGNALPEVKQLASLITTDVKQDGIWHAFEALGLLLNK